MSSSDESVVDSSISPKYRTIESGYRKAYSLGREDTFDATGWKSIYPRRTDENNTLLDLCIEYWLPRCFSALKKNSNFLYLCCSLELLAAGQSKLPYCSDLFDWLTVDESSSVSHVACSYAAYAKELTLRGVYAGTQEFNTSMYSLIESRHIIIPDPFIDTVISRLCIDVPVAMSSIKILIDNNDGDIDYAKVPDELILSCIVPPCGLRPSLNCFDWLNIDSVLYPGHYEVGCAMVYYQNGRTPLANWKGPPVAISRTNYAKSSLWFNCVRQVRDDQVLRDWMSYNAGSWSVHLNSNDYNNHVNLYSTEYNPFFTNLFDSDYNVMVQIYHRCCVIVYNCLRSIHGNGFRSLSDTFFDDGMIIGLHHDHAIARLYAYLCKMRRLPSSLAYFYRPATDVIRADCQNRVLDSLVSCTLHVYAQYAIDFCPDIKRDSCYYRFDGGIFSGFYLLSGENYLNSKDEKIPVPVSCNGRFVDYVQGLPDYDIVMLKMTNARHVKMPRSVRNKLQIGKYDFGRDDVRLYVPSSLVNFFPIEKDGVTYLNVGDEHAVAVEDISNFDSVSILERLSAAGLLGSYSYSRSFGPVSVDEYNMCKKSFDVSDVDLSDLPIDVFTDDTTPSSIALFCHCVHRDIVCRFVLDNIKSDSHPWHKQYLSSTACSMFGVSDLGVYSWILGFSVKTIPSRSITEFVDTYSKEMKLDAVDPSRIYDMRNGLAKHMNFLRFVHGEQPVAIICPKKLSFSPNVSGWSYSMHPCNDHERIIVYVKKTSGSKSRRSSRS